MKINPNDPAYPIRGMQIDEDGNSRAYGLPIRLAIAAQVCSGVWQAASGKVSFSDLASDSLQMADALIDAYNEGAK